MTHRTFAATIAHAILLPIAALAFFFTGITHEAPTGGRIGTTDTAAAQRPAAAPTWDSHGGAKGCEPMREGVLTDLVLVVTQQGDVERMDFDSAWAVVQDDEPANDVYVVGACR